MIKYEYKTVIFEVERNLGFFSSKVNSNASKPIENELNRLGQDGWRLTAVFPVTDGASPAQISKAVHHFIREIVN